MNALFRIFGKWQYALLAQAILKEKDSTTLTTKMVEISENAVKIAASFKSWFDDQEEPHDPTGWVGQLFIDSLAKRLREMGCESTMIETVIVNGSYREFYEILPAAQKKAAPIPTDGVPVTSDKTSTVDNEPTEYTDFELEDDDRTLPVWVSIDEVIETAQAGLKRGRIDQKFYFLNPESAAHWKDVIDSGYDQYKQCYAALESFTNNSTVWQESLQAGKINGTVMLGGGGADKDLLLVRSMLEFAPPGTVVNYGIVDVSFYMLMSAFRIVAKALISDGTRKRVRLKPVVRDFFNLQGTRANLRRNGKNVAWFLPGGTIGNLNERHLLESVADKSDPGDLLVVGADLVDSTDPSAFRRALQEKYSSPSIRTFVVAPLRAAWHDLKIEGRLEKSLQDINVLLVDGITNEHSVVPGTTTVELFIRVDGRKVVLLTSTRYEEQELINFVVPFGYRFVEMVSCPTNAHYKQFVFERVLREDERGNA